MGGGGSVGCGGGGDGGAARLQHTSDALQEWSGEREMSRSGYASEVV